MAVFIHLKVILVTLSWYLQCMVVKRKKKCCDKDTNSTTKYFILKLLIV